MDYSEFLSKCKDFHTVEYRSEDFPAAINKIRHGEGKKEGIKLLLKSWNKRHVNKFSEVELDEDITSALKASKDYVEALEGRHFETINFQDNSITKAIKEAFRVFQSKETIRGVGAAKALALLNQHVFLMWDTEVAKVYRIHTYQRQRGFRYVTFMKRNRKRFAPLLEERTEQEMWTDHLSDLSEKIRDNYTQINFQESFPKMVDEYNYVKYTLRV